MKLISTFLILASLLISGCGSGSGGDGGGSGNGANWDSLQWDRDTWN